MVYDGAGLFSAARVWWTFRMMGFARIAVLNGGLPKWRAEGRPVTDAPPSPSVPHLHMMAQPAMVRSAEQVLEATRNGSARDRGRPLCRPLSR